MSTGTAGTARVLRAARALKVGQDKAHGDCSALRQGGRRACVAASATPPPRRMRGERAGGAIPLWPRRGLRACAVVRAAGRLREGPGQAAVGAGAGSGPGLLLRLKRAPGPGNLGQGLP